MDKTIITELVKDIINNEVFMNWKSYLILLSVIVIGNFFSNFLKSYSTKRGEHLATRADLDEIIKQQKILTETTETIRNEIQHSLWKKKELITIKRQKLEELLTLVYDQQEWIDQEQGHILFHVEENFKSEPINRIYMISRLYFPEIVPSTLILKAVNLKYSKWLLDGQKEILEKQRAGEQICTSSDQHREKYTEVRTALIDAVSKIEDACSELMERLLNS